MIPGRAIGRRSRNEIPSRPKNLKRLIANEAAVPNTMATAVEINPIFTFSLTLGDFITPALVGGANSQFIGNVVHNYVGISNNVPLAAAFATVPVIVMAVYLVIAKRLGAFEAL